MTREERAIDMRNRALELVRARGTPTGETTREYTNVGMTIELRLIIGTRRLTGV
jgi:hypothetical protein